MQGMWLTVLSDAGSSLQPGWKYPLLAMWVTFSSGLGSEQELVRMPQVGARGKAMSSLRDSSALQVQSALPRASIPNVSSPGKAKDTTQTLYGAWTPVTTTAPTFGFLILFLVPQ